MVWKELLDEEICVAIGFIKQMSNHFFIRYYFYCRKVFIRCFMETLTVVKPETN